MKDFATSSSPAVQAQLDRLAALSLPQGRLGMETMRAMMERLGDPHLRLPPVFHVAGTNGKGSTCAFLRAMLEAQGYSVHATTSPHLVRYNERIRVAGKLIEDARLAQLLAEVLDACEGLNPSFFEVTIAASFLEFARVPADACVVEVGLGGRFDATNVIPRPAVCGIAALGIDHERFLLAPDDAAPAAPFARIAFEKAGIAKPGVPLVTMDYVGDASDAIDQTIAKVARQANARVIRPYGEYFWRVRKIDEARIAYTDLRGRSRPRETLTLPLPNLHGRYQIKNAGLAIAMLRHQDDLDISRHAIAEGLVGVCWPARLHKLRNGPLIGSRTVWLDGGHNPSAAHELWMFMLEQVVAPTLKPFHLIVGMLDNKDAASFLKRSDRMLADIIATITVVPVPGHDSHPASAFGPDTAAAPDIPTALAALPDDDLPVLIAGSLYLAGEVLRLNLEFPD